MKRFVLLACFALSLSGCLDDNKKETDAIGKAMKDVSDVSFHAGLCTGYNVCAYGGNYHADIEVIAGLYRSNRVEEIGPFITSLKK